MTNNRPTKVIKTTVGDHTVELYTFLTAREKAEAEKVLAKEAKLTQDTESNMKQTFSAQAFMDFNDALARAIIKSVDGIQPGFDLLLDMESGVLDEVRPEVQKVYDNAVAFQTRSSTK